MIKALDISDTVRSTLRDNFAGAKAYEDTEVMQAINSALLWLVGADTSASITTEAIPLVEGIHQKLPADGVRLVDVWHNNKGAVTATIDGKTFRGTAPLRYIDQSKYRFCLPDWDAAPRAAIAVNVMVNKDDPTHFMVYPPNDGTGEVIATFSKEVAALTKPDMTETIALPGVYFVSLMNYTLYMLLTRDGEDQSNAGRATAFFEKAERAVQQIAMANMTAKPDAEARG